MEQHHSTLHEYHRQRLSSDHGKFKTIISSLSGLTEPSLQLAVLTELCEVLSFCTEGSISSMTSDLLSPLLVKLAQHESNPEWTNQTPQFPQQINMHTQKINKQKKGNKNTKQLLWRNKHTMTAKRTRSVAKTITRSWRLKTTTVSNYYRRRSFRINKITQTNRWCYGEF